MRGKGGRLPYFVGFRHEPPFCCYILAMNGKFARTKKKLTQMSKYIIIPMWQKHSNQNKQK